MSSGWRILASTTGAVGLDATRLAALREGGHLLDHYVDRTGRPPVRSADGERHAVADERGRVDAGYERWIAQA